MEATVNTSPIVNCMECGNPSITRTTLGEGEWCETCGYIAIIPQPLLEEFINRDNAELWKLLERGNYYKEVGR